MEIYSVKNLSFTYPGEKQIILDNISFSVMQGEFVTVCGLSGSGKSTLLRHLKTVLTPFGKMEGEIRYKGKSIDTVDELTQAKEIGFVMQSPDHQSVTDKVWHELAFGLENLGEDSGTIRRKTAETAAYFGISDILHQNICELSGGQKQLLNLASVMIMNPEVVILDEPVSQLDPIAADTFISYLKKINDELGITIILCEHILENVFSISDSIIIMSHGKVVSDTVPRKAAAEMYRMGDGMFDALPVSSRVYTYTGGLPDGTALTVREGRKWLSEYVRDKTLTDIHHRSLVYDKKKIPVLELKNVCFRYRKALPDVLKGLNMKAYAGEILSLLGGNGSGKTTLLLNILGFLRPYSGKVLIGGKERKKSGEGGSGIALLPQNPQSLFVRDTVEEDLYDVFTEKKKNTVNKELVNAVIKLCGLEGLKKRHPYDLSGGEQQKAALAKVLLTRPKVLLLDEPVKGLDIKSKNEIGLILRELANHGTAIVLVSHDTDFCAEYSDRCTLFFDGGLTETVNPQLFFSQNSFYTTAARRLSVNIIENAVTADDILAAIGKERKKSDHNPGSKISDIMFPVERADEQRKKKKFSMISFTKAVLIILFIVSAAMTVNIFGIPVSREIKLPCFFTMIITSIILMLYGAAYSKKIETIPVSRIRKTDRLTIMSLLLIFAAVPITIFIGIYYFNDSKYLFISLLIMLECMLPSFALFEKRGIKTREIVLIAVMCALCVTARSVFYMFPQFKPVTAMIIISGTVLGAETGFFVGAVSMLASNVIFGQGPWTPWQMFTMGIIGFISGFLFGRGIIPRSRLTFCLFGFLAALIIYGGIMDPAAMIMSHIEPTWNNLKAYYMTGLPLDIIHAISTSVFLFVASEPIIKKVERVKHKYGLIHQD